MKFGIGIETTVRNNTPKVPEDGGCARDRGGVLVGGLTVIAKYIRNYGSYQKTLNLRNKLREISDKMLFDIFCVEQLVEEINRIEKWQNF